MGQDPWRAEEEALGQSRRDFLRALGGAIGVALVADASTLGGMAEAAGHRHGAKHASGYIFHRVLTSGGGNVDEILPGVMINNRSEVIFHAQSATKQRSVYRMAIGHGRKPGGGLPKRIVTQGELLPGGVRAERIAIGDTNDTGDYVTVIRGAKHVEGVYRQRPGGAIETVVKYADRAPGGGIFSGRFGDVDLDIGGSILLVGAYEQGGRLFQGLIELPSGGRPGQVILRSGQRIPGTRAIATGFGLVERRGKHYIVQVFGRQSADLSRLDMKSEPSAFLAGQVARGSSGARILTGAPAIAAASQAVSGEAYVGPRIHRDGTAATVTHTGPESLHLHRHGSGRRKSRIARTGGRAHGGRISTISAPVFGPHGLLYYRAITNHTMELQVVDGNDRRRILHTGDRVSGAKLSSFSFGWHPDQIDRKGRLAFQAELADGRTAIVVGTPV
jgi:hypothetical protein